MRESTASSCNWAIELGNEKRRLILGLKQNNALALRSWFCWTLIQSPFRCDETGLNMLVGGVSRENYGPISGEVAQPYSTELARLP